MSSNISNPRPQRGKRDGRALGLKWPVPVDRYYSLRIRDMRVLPCVEKMMPILRSLFVRSDVLKSEPVPEMKHHAH
jgi:hypothetical protein